MDDAIDYGAVVTQLQLENELLRNHMRAFMQVREAVKSVPVVLQELYSRASANIMHVVAGLLLLYCVLSLSLQFWQARGGPSI